MYIITYLLTYTIGSGRIKPALSPKDKAKVTVNVFYKIVHGLLISAKMYDLE